MLRLCDRPKQQQQRLCYLPRVTHSSNSMGAIDCWLGWCGYCWNNALGEGSESGCLPSPIGHCQNKVQILVVCVWVCISVCVCLGGREEETRRQGGRKDDMWGMCVCVWVWEFISKLIQSVEKQWYTLTTRILLKYSYYSTISLFKWSLVCVITMMQK